MVKERRVEVDHPPLCGSWDLLPEAWGPAAPAGPRQGWAGRGRSAGRRERGGEDSSGSYGGRTCRRGGRLTARRKGSEDRGCGVLRRRLESRGQAAFISFCSGVGGGGGCTGRNRDPARRWALPRLAFCPIPGRCVPDALSSMPLSSGTRAGQVWEQKEGAQLLGVNACARALC